ncbi:MAG: hypothetical protein WCX88_03035, partial [Patescibacteria group bacterium]
ALFHPAKLPDRTLSPAVFFPSLSPPKFTRAGLRLSGGEFFRDLVSGSLRFRLPSPRKKILQLVKFLCQVFLFRF